MINQNNNNNYVHYANSDKDSLSYNKKTFNDESESFIDIVKRIKNKRCSIGFICIEIGVIIEGFNFVDKKKDNLVYNKLLGLNNKDKITIKPLIIIDQSKTMPTIIETKESEINESNSNKENQCDDSFISGVSLDMDDNFKLSRFKQNQSIAFSKDNLNLKDTLFNESSNYNDLNEYNLLTEENYYLKKINEYIDLKQTNLSPKYYRNVSLGINNLSDNTFDNGINLIIVKRNKQYNKVFEKTYNTNNYENESEKLSDKIKSTTSEYIIILTGIGKYLGCMTVNLIKEIKQIGGPDFSKLISFYSDNSINSNINISNVTNHSFLVIGRKGLCKQNGVYMINNLNNNYYSSSSEIDPSIVCNSLEISNYFDILNTNKIYFENIYQDNFNSFEKIKSIKLINNNYLNDNIENTLSYIKTISENIHVYGNSNKEHADTNSKLNNLFKFTDMRMSIDISSDNRFSFKYPTINSIYPNKGSIKGGDEIKISGFNMGYSTNIIESIYVKGVYCGDILLLSTNLVSCITRESKVYGAGGGNVIIKYKNGITSTEKTCNMYLYVNDVIDNKYSESESIDTEQSCNKMLEDVNIYKKNNNLVDKNNIDKNNIDKNNKNNIFIKETKQKTITNNIYNKNDTQKKIIRNNFNNKNNLNIKKVFTNDSKNKVINKINFSTKKNIRSNRFNN